MGNRSIADFWTPFVDAIERHEVGVVFAFADTGNQDVTHDYAKRLRAALKANRLRLEATRDVKKAPLRSTAFRQWLRKQCPSGNRADDYAFAKPFFGASLACWE
mmetsp:Transcript_6853/g.21248  ORF Transcript_6853/g.21248 Transcript_6853/m.21248 type:complete len:104 (+) Transcript_6853:328-639(+)